MKKEVSKVLKYFKIFAYHPTLDELYMFLPVKINKSKLKYTPVEYSIRRKISQKKLNNWRFQLYIKLVSLFPQIRLIGLSGSISMMNAGENDDIDLFIITAKNRLFTGRLVASILALIFGLKRSREKGNNKNKVCLNLFFDESNLKVPRFKQTLFVGHEVLQMKPIINKGYAYEKFLDANRWVFRLFPNAVPPVIPAKAGIQIKKNTGSPTRSGMTSSSLIFDLFEKVFKKLQLNSINKHKTSEVITNSQLWFHPDDFEKKINKKLG